MKTKFLEQKERNKNVPSAKESENKTSSHSKFPPTLQLKAYKESQSESSTPIQLKKKKRSIKTNHADIDPQDLNKNDNHFVDLDDNGGSKNPYRIQLQVVGSGGKYWKYEEDKNKKDVQSAKTDGRRLSKKKGIFKLEQDNDHVKFHLYGPGHNFAGGSINMGDHSIINNIKHGKKLIKKSINEISYSDPDRPIEIDIKGHSRGAVSATKIAEYFNAKYQYNTNINVNLAALDPVPGPGEAKKFEKASLGGMNLSTVVHSLSDKRTPFISMKTTGAQRIIYTLRGHTDHVKTGFLYKGNHYHGYSLNDLEPGIYFDDHFEEEPLSREMVKCKTIDDIMEKALINPKKQRNLKLLNKNRDERTFYKELVDHFQEPEMTLDGDIKPIDKKEISKRKKKYRDDYKFNKAIKKIKRKKGKKFKEAYKKNKKANKKK